MNDFQHGVGVLGDLLEPAFVAGLIGAGLARFPASAHERHRDLGAEARAQAEGELAVVVASLAERDAREFRVRLLEIGDGREFPQVHGPDRHDVLEARAHGVAGKSLGVGHHDFGRVGSEDGLERLGFGLRAPPLGRRVGLMGHEEHLAGHVRAGESVAEFRLGDEALHGLADVPGVKARDMVGAVVELGRQELG